MIWMSLWSFLWIFWIITNKIYAHFHIMCRTAESFIALVQFSCQWIVSDSVQIVCFSLNHHRPSLCVNVLICSSLMPTARKQHPSLFLFNECVWKAEWFYAGAFLLLHFCSVPWRALVNGKIKQRARAAVDVRVWVSLDWLIWFIQEWRDIRGSFVDAEVHDWFLIYKLSHFRCSSAPPYIFSTLFTCSYVCPYTNLLHMLHNW